ncbi:MAG: hypothetical protein ABR95_03495 [Sphingobacteriales bacterium BACL12 MAG-120813-bin55]|jgi:ferredoxin-type protein NapH|nr:MAG: hypothetical protein ABR94_05110 [Sphingobacteriales bacterium BACL12 MAG-120802-bin5]KRP12394.1 MAG: hypothetical protein ABR95_03495 [Sphingobacteriales bacterium BACL12 MAG-120813-bin55]
MNNSDISMSLANPHPANYNTLQKIGLAVIALGVLSLALAWVGIGSHQALLLLLSTLLGLGIGGLIFFYGTYGHLPEGIKNNRAFFSSISSRGALGWMLGIVLTGFYVSLYFFPEYMSGLTNMFEPLSQALRGTPSSQWFVYGTFYTVAVLVMGIKFIMKYRHSRYQVLRTISVSFFQLIFAWLLPAIMVRLYNYEPYLTYFWPLDYDAIFPSNIKYILSNGRLGQFVVVWGLVLTFIGTPVLTYFFGKRWYCSWVCGCGGLAETAGDPFRHLSDKSLRAWKIERVLIHSILGIILIMTALLLVDSAAKGGLLGESAGKSMAKTYGFLIGSIFAGVIGTGFYPILGNRAWCRFGCPMAAYLGIIQRFKSRFRITTNGGQCISCGNCSTYCEMGIDVRWYAQRGQNIVRSSCVGCGVCSAVCPRGVLKLENGPENANRTGIQLDNQGLIPLEAVKILD